LYAECVSNVDETLGEMFLEEKTPTEDDIRVGYDKTSIWYHTAQYCIRSSGCIFIF